MASTLEHLLDSLRTHSSKVLDAEGQAQMESLARNSLARSRVADSLKTRKQLVVRFIY